MPKFEANITKHQHIEVDTSEEDFLDWLRDMELEVSDVDSDVVHDFIQAQLEEDAEYFDSWDDPQVKVKPAEKEPLGPRDFQRDDA